MVPQKARTMDMLKLKSLKRGTETAFLAPRWYDEQPVTLIWETPPPPGRMFGNPVSQLHPIPIQSAVLF